MFFIFFSAPFNALPDSSISDCKAFHEWCKGQIKKITGSDGILGYFKLFYQFGIMDNQFKRELMKVGYEDMFYFVCY